jgi:hypothetical protein
MAVQFDRKKQQDDYLEFRAIKTKEDALAFWKARVPNPVGKTYFTPMDYRWFVMPLKYSLQEAHKRRWNSFWGLLHIGEKQKDDAEFEKTVHLLVKTYVGETDALGDWVTSRYDIGRSYLLPAIFSTSKEEAPEDWEKSDNLDDIAARESKADSVIDYDILYYWKEVKPEKEPDDGRRHCILVDRVTHLEAPLLPGQAAYV